MPKSTGLLLAFLVVSIAALVFTYRGHGEVDATISKASLGVDPKLASLRSLVAIDVASPVTRDAYRASRNLFEFAIDPALLEQQRLARIAPEKERRIAEQRRPDDVRREPPAVDARAAVADPVMPTFEAWRYVAYIGRGRNDFVAVMSKRDASPPKPELFVVGDTIDGTFRVTTIDVDTVTVGYTDPRYADRAAVARLSPGRN